MNLTPRAVAMLLTVYPAAWRREYGAELHDILAARPLNARIVADVVWCGMRERIRRPQPSTLVGLCAMGFVLASLVTNIAFPSLGGRGLTSLLQESSKTLPTVVVTPFASDLYGLFLIAFGCWTYLNRGFASARPGAATAWISFVACVPIMFAGGLMMTGVVGLSVVGPGDASAKIAGHGLVYTYYSPGHHPLSPLAVLTAPLFRLPQSWMFGAIGGWLGRFIERRRAAVAR